MLSSSSDRNMQGSGIYAKLLSMDVKQQREQSKQLVPRNQYHGRMRSVSKRSTQSRISSTSKVVIRAFYMGILYG